MNKQLEPPITSTPAATDRQATPVLMRPVNTNWGAKRGTPVSRYFIDRFMESHRPDITGVVLEIKNRRYTDCLGHDLIRADVLDIDASNSDANIITDLATADCIPSDTYDCVMINETLQFVFDLRSAIAHAYRILKPGGVLLVTVTCTVQHDGELKDFEMWHLTPSAGQRLFSEPFGANNVEVESYGNFLGCSAGLAGLAFEDLDPGMLQEDSPRFVQGICVRAVKSSPAPARISLPGLVPVED